MMVAVTGVMIAHNNEHKALIRLSRDLLPALRRTPVDAELIVIDNSEAPSRHLEDAVRRSRIGARYCWCNGDNLRYGPAMNLAVKLASHPYLLYVCTNHGHSRDPSWPLDLLAPLISDETVAMTGTLADSGPPANLGFDSSLPSIHVQGGVFAARTDLLRRFPYPDAGDYIHWGADIFEGFQLMAAGYRLVDVPTIKSVWRTAAGEGSWKYVHEDSA